MDVRRVCAAVAIALLWGVPADAQPEPIPPMHQHGEAVPTTAEDWHLMQDGVVYGLFNHQGGPRGGTEFVVPNWWMGVLTRAQGRHQFGLNGMLSLDPATVGKSGYGEIFQVGETLDGKPLVDRQHPHDLLMQLAAWWRISFSPGTALVVAGGPAGEPTLGPVAFMHRASAAGLPLAPLGHHTFDSTHISYGVVSASVEQHRWTIEGSVFNGREPDEHRWDLDLGTLNSVAGRVWFRPTDEWEVQVSTGLLRDPEALAPGDERRTTTSVSWTRERPGGFLAATVGAGATTSHGDRRHGVFAELTSEGAVHSLSGRLEVQQVETDLLITGEIPEHVDPGQEPSTVTALTLGAGRTLGRWRGFESAVAVQVSVYGVPDVLRPTHGQWPVSFQMFLRVRLPSGSMGRMWNMRMSAGHEMGSNRADHAMP